MKPRTDTHDLASPFHEGEHAVQSQLGVRQAIEPWARKVIRPFMPQQHRDFYTQLPFVVASARDAGDRQWVTLLAGPPGFIQSPDSRGLQFAALPHPGDALADALQPGTDLGLLGIELETRRRNRVNGRVGVLREDGFRFDVGQAFGNCPQYITERAWRQVDVTPEEASTTRQQYLDAGMQRWISKADTFFIGSGYRGDGTANDAFGMDASHRGGAPGFVRVLSNTRLVFPDYAGNNHFNTIGNLVLDPRVGLLFVDFESGSLMQITGRATIDFDSEEVTRHPDAQRLVIIDIEEIFNTKNSSVVDQYLYPAQCCHLLNHTITAISSAQITINTCKCTNRFLHAFKFSETATMYHYACIFINECLGNGLAYTFGRACNQDEFVAQVGHVLFL